tara:strand:+ start:421 stop:939 length:519 start_codon:yes stop_codon:yes gene_type:complete
MGTNLHDVYYCGQSRTSEISSRFYERNIPSQQMGASYFGRPVTTYGVTFPNIDCVKASTVAKSKFPVYCQHSIFNPGQAAPYNGFAKNVDVESQLHNSFAPLQKAPQSKYIPSSKSDMYNANYLTQTTKQTNIKHNLLFKETNFKSYNPNNCNLGHKIFNNHIRQQIKDVKL